MKTEKARIDLIPPEALYGMAEAFEDGANKRAAHNWEVGTSSKEWSLVDRLAAIQRHVLRLQLGEDLATDSQVHHAAHIMANAAMIYTMYIRKSIGKDDRIFNPWLHNSEALANVDLELKRTIDLDDDDSLWESLEVRQLIEEHYKNQDR